VPPRPAIGFHRGEEGTASVEAVAVVPFLLLAVLVAAQIGLVGQALWSAAIAARAGARAALVDRGAERSARRAIPAGLRDRSAVEASGAVGVRLPVLRLTPFIPPATVKAETTLEGGDG
jgi:hypothetical protein